MGSTLPPLSSVVPNNIVPIDTIGVMCDGQGNQLSGYFGSDGLHPTTIGANAEGGAIAGVLNQFAPPVRAVAHSNTDLYNATYNFLGNRVANGLMIGSGGTLSNSGATGTVANDWAAGTYTSANFATASPTLTVACALVTSSLIANLSMQQLTLGGTSAGSDCATIQQLASGSGWQAGDQIVFEQYVEWDASLTNVQCIGMQANFFFNAWGQEGFAGSAQPWMSAAGSMLIRTNPITLPAGYPSDNQNIIVNPFVQTYQSGAASGNVRFSRVRAQKIGPNLLAA